ncbi:Peptidase G2, IMC autoproteolytic cleavage domain containing protein [uncultured Caudovirales phage]|uniref:Peptidase G2, IMC autoproteolytic cleavage domain containing protein n=1 Tax=uncultured Caudovirales phage TaxID=2100421 RepID=A0A6J5T9S4_9CAUD|nr:Peptidase G2, IMC autoproteolytic cleavage domain containing protein [uncultured Caudovirales phage]
MTTAIGYAEMFEWEDGNPNNEDRVGHTVVLRNDKIVIANNANWHIEPTDIIGVIGGDNTSVSAISNGSPDEWHNKHVRDAANRLLWEPQVMVEWVTTGFRHWYESDRVPEGITVPDDATYYTTFPGQTTPLHREKLSEEYKNPNKVVEPYLPRWDRKEWGIVVLLGRAIVREGSLCEPSWKKLRSWPGELGGAPLSEWLIR